MGGSSTFRGAQTSSLRKFAEARKMALFRWAEGDDGDLGSAPEADPDEVGA